MALNSTNALFLRVTIFGIISRLGAPYNWRPFGRLFFASFSWEIFSFCFFSYKKTNPGISSPLIVRISLIIRLPLIATAKKIYICCLLDLENFLLCVLVQCTRTQRSEKYITTSHNNNNQESTAYINIQKHFT